MHPVMHKIVRGNREPSVVIAAMVAEFDFDTRYDHVTRAGERTIGWRLEHLGQTRRKLAADAIAALDGVHARPPVSCARRVAIPSIRAMGEAAPHPPLSRHSRNRGRPCRSSSTVNRLPAPIELTRNASMSPRHASSGVAGSCPASINGRQSDVTSAAPRAIRPAAWQVPEPTSSARMQSSCEA